MESPLKVDEELEKAYKDAKSKKPAAPLSNLPQTNIVWKALLAFVGLVAFVLLGLAFFTGEEIKEIKNPNGDGEKRAEADKNNQQDSSWQSKRSGENIFYHNKEYGFDLSLPESWENYKVEEGEKSNPLQETVLSFSSPKSSAENFAVIVYRRNDWENYINQCAKYSVCDETKLGENDSYVFAKKKSDSSRNDIADALKAGEIAETKKLNKNLNENLNENESSSPVNTNSSRKSSNNNLNHSPSNSNSQTNRNVNSSSKGNCTYPSGNVLEWWFKSSKEEKECYISRHGIPDFGDTEPYFCDYENSEDCVITK